MLFYLCFFVKLTIRLRTRIAMANGMVSRRRRPIPCTGVILLSLPSSTFITKDVDGRRNTFDLGIGRAGSILHVSSVNCTAICHPLSGEDASLKVVYLTSSARVLTRIIMGTSVPIAHVENSTLIAGVRGDMLSGTKSTDSMLKGMPNMVGREGSCRMLNGKAPLVCVGKQRMHSSSRLSRLGSRSVGDMRIIAGPNTHCSTAMATIVHVRAVQHTKSNFNFSLHSDCCRDRGMSLVRRLGMGCHRGKLSVFNVFHCLGGRCVVGGSVMRALRSSSL